LTGAPAALTFRSMRRIVWTSWCVVALVACSRDAPPKPEPSHVTTVTAEQLLTHVRELRAKAVLVNAWATWCDSCQHELPMLQKLAETYAARGVRVLLVSVDEAGEGQQVSAFLNENGVALTSYLAARPLGSFKEGMNPRWPGMLPASFLFDPAGKLRYFWPGEAYENEVVPVLDGLLAGQPIDGEANVGLAPGAARQAR
jgi:thiol-disulfide isomerase/thioredoxin